MTTQDHTTDSTDSTEGGTDEGHGAELGRAAARGTLWLGLVNVLSKGAQMLVILALGHFLTPLQFGVVTVAITMLNLAQAVQAMGVFDVVSRTRHDPLRFAGTLATAALASGVVLMVVGYLSADVVAEVLHQPLSADLLRAGAFGLPFLAYAGVQLAYLHRILDFRRRIVPDSGSALLGAAVTITAAALGAGAWSLVLGYLTTSITSPLLGLVVGIRIRPRFDRGHLVEAARWVAVTGPGALAGVVLLYVDYLVIGGQPAGVLAPDALGVYSFAYRIAFVPYITVAVVLGGVAFPVYARLTEAGGPTAVAPALGRFWHVVCTAVGGMYVAGFVLADRIVVISPQWAGSVATLRVLCGYGMLLSLVLTCHEVIRAVGLARTYLVAQLAHVGLLAASAALLVRVDGIVGVAWAQVFSAGVILVALVIVAARAGALRASAVVRGLAGPALAAGVVVTVAEAARAARLMPPPGSLPGLLAVGTAVTAVYLAVLVVVDRPALRDLSAALRKESPR